MTPAAFELDKVSKTYHLWRRLRRTPVAGVSGVSLSVPKGIIFGLLGLNGAGKTTTMKLLVGLLRPDSGQVRVLGGPVGDPAIRSRTGFLPELPYLPQMLTARELLGHYGRLSGLSGRHLANRVEAALTSAGIVKRSGDPLKFFSKGMLQRAAMAQVLLHSPEVVFVDEPLSGLDPLGISEMRSILEGLRREGVTVCLNSHQISEVERLCDRIGIMAGGKMVREGAVGELLALAGSRRYRVVILAKPVRGGPGWKIEEKEASESGLAALLAGERKKGARILQILALQGSLEEVVLETIRNAG
jgi:ABC-2 type transport system ATP-binding protein